MKTNKQHKFESNIMQGYLSPDCTLDDRIKFFELYFNIKFKWYQKLYLKLFQLRKDKRRKRF